MKRNREELIKHLQRIACGGQVDEVVFSEGFATSALTPDHLLCVIAPSLPKADLKQEVGVGRLHFFMKALGALSGVGNDAVEVNITVKEHRLLLNEDERGKQFLLTANPSTIGTRIEEETREKLLAAAPDDEDGIPLTRALVEGIQNTFALYKAEEVELHIGAKKGKYSVGNENSDYSEFPDKSLAHGGKKADDYSLLFGQHLIDVLGIISNYSEASLCLGGPDTMILIKDGEYRYILSPRSKGAEAEEEEDYPETAEEE